jgi:hypothetical protein
MMLAFPEYAPDIADYNGAFTKTATNVVPRGDGYGPFKAHAVYSSGIPAACRGFFYARKTDGTVAVFAGTSTRLYLMSNTDFTWSDVSKGGSAYTGLSSAAQWQFAQFGNFVIAVHANVPPQVFDLSSSTAFADLSGSPPQAGGVAVVGRFLVMFNLLSNPYRVQWSGLNATTTWTPGTNSSDFQDLPDGGAVRGVAGGEFGHIFQDSTIRRMIYVPGSPLIFQIERVAEDKGLLAPYALIRAGERVFFPSAQGFHVITGASAPVPIGKEKFDRTFLADYDTSSPQLLIGAADPAETRVYWAYKSVSGSSGLFDKLLAYDYALNRATTINVSGEYLSSLARPGVTLESLDSVSSSIDALTFSLDDVSVAALARLSAVNSAHRLGFFSADNLEATIDTAEQSDGSRVRVKGFRPITDAATCYGAISGRETAQAAATYSTEQPVDMRGLCPANVSTRLARGRIRIPAATSWSYAAGVEPVFAPEGRR